MRADNNIVVANNRGQRADRDDDRKRGESCRDEGETKNVGFTCAPVPIKQRGGAFPVNVARPMNPGSCKNFGHRLRSDSRWAAGSLASSFSRLVEAPGRSRFIRVCATRLRLRFPRFGETYPVV